MNLVFIVIGVVLVVLGAMAPAAVFGTLQYGTILPYISIVLGVIAVLIGVFWGRSHHLRMRR